MKYACIRVYISFIYHLTTNRSSTVQNTIEHAYIFESQMKFYYSFYTEQNIKL